MTFAGSYGTHYAIRFPSFIEFILQDLAPRRKMKSRIF
jgi:hypothetical protein